MSMWNFHRDYDRSLAMTQRNIERRTRTEILILRRKDDPPHGSRAAYIRGCACAKCRQANTEASRIYRRDGAYRG